MARKNKLSDESPRLIKIRAAIKELVRKGLVVDSGWRRWVQEAGRYEIVWKLKDVGNTLH
jgi:hypothetical protein